MQRSDKRAIAKEPNSDTGVTGKDWVYKSGNMQFRGSGVLTL